MTYFIFLYKQIIYTIKQKENLMLVYRTKLINSVLQLELNGIIVQNLLLTRCCTAWPNFDFEIRRDNKRISYERRVYESVDDNSLSQEISQKQTEKELLQQRVKFFFILFFWGTLFFKENFIWKTSILKTRGSN